MSVRTVWRTGLTKPAWLLALSPLGFVVLIVTAVAVLSPSGIGVFDDITPAQMAAVQVGWIAFHVVLGLAVLVGCVGVAMVGRALRPSWFAEGAIVVAAASIAVLAVHVVLRAGMVDFTASTVAQDGRYALSNTLSLFAGWFAYGATALCGLGLWQGGRLRRTGAVVATLSAVFLVIDIVTGGLVPPFVVSLLWSTIGIGLVRRRSAAGTQEEDQARR